MNTAVRGCVLLRHCRMEFMKHVLPRLLMPTAPFTHGFPTVCFSPHRSLQIKCYILYNICYFVSHIIIIMVEIMLYHAVLSYVVFCYHIVLLCYAKLQHVMWCKARLVMVVMAIRKSELAHTHTHSNTHIHMHTHAYTCIHTHTHTHTQ